MSEDFQPHYQRQVTPTCRYAGPFGGEEFVILLPNTSIEGAQNISDQILSALSATKIEHKYSITTDHVTASMV